MEIVQIYFNNLNKLAVITNFLAFFLFFIRQFFPPGSGSRSQMNADPCGSGSTALAKANINLSCETLFLLGLAGPGAEWGLEWCGPHRSLYCWQRRRLHRWNKIGQRKGQQIWACHMRLRDACALGRVGEVPRMTRWPQRNLEVFGNLDRNSGKRPVPVVG